ncbi:hypothetical protein P3T18_006124 [Paraburkholderia sp. GAS199]|uniref:hypothetical protein n=1 Tax=Paraburkholderia sp. GAS199 TaxID=3035126 RepID=UPI003D213BF7
MRNVRTSLIVAVFVVELIFGAFLLLHKSSRSTGSDGDSDGATHAAEVMAATDPRFGNSHVTVGTVAVAAQTVNAPAAPVPPIPVTTARPVVVAPVAAQADTSASLAAQVPVTPPSVDGKSYAAHGSRWASRGEVHRDGLTRHGSNPVAAALTDELVKESAKLDPDLPPPEPMNHVDAYQPAAHSDTSLQAARSGSNPSGPGSSARFNPVASAMTEQLVKESARLDPALPPPDPTGAK